MENSLVLENQHSHHHVPVVSVQLKGYVFFNLFVLYVLFINFIYFSQAQCASLRITDCSQLAREWPRESILRDDVCSAQCGLVLQNGQNNQLRADFNLPLHRQTRSRQIQTFQTFQGFRFPDLTQFIV